MEGTQGSMSSVEGGTCIGESNLTRQVFRPARRAAEMLEMVFDDLRHSLASALLRARRHQGGEPAVGPFYG